MIEDQNHNCQQQSLPAWLESPEDLTLAVKSLIRFYSETSSCPWSKVRFASGLVHVLSQSHHGQPGRAHASNAMQASALLVIHCSLRIDTDRRRAVLTAFSRFRCLGAQAQAARGASWPVCYSRGQKRGCQSLSCPFASRTARAGDAGGAGGWIWAGVLAGETAHNRLLGRDMTIRNTFVCITESPIPFYRNGLKQLPQGRIRKSDHSSLIIECVLCQSFFAQSIWTITVLLLPTLLGNSAWDHAVQWEVTEQRQGSQEKLLYKVD